MKKICSILLVGVGLLNVIPVIGVLSAEQLTTMYGIVIDSPDLETLMRHRAVMLGLVGAFLLFAAFRQSLQIIAATIGLVSMLSFVILAYLTGDHGVQVNKVVIADIVGSIFAAIVLILAVMDVRRAE